MKRGRRKMFSPQRNRLFGYIGLFSAFSCCCVCWSSRPIIPWDFNGSDSNSRVGLCLDSQVVSGVMYFLSPQRNGLLLFLILPRYLLLVRPRNQIPDGKAKQRIILFEKACSKPRSRWKDPNQDPIWIDKNCIEERNEEKKETAMTMDVVEFKRTTPQILPFTKRGYDVTFTDFPQVFTWIKYSNNHPCLQNYNHNNIRETPYHLLAM